VDFEDSRVIMCEARMSSTNVLRTNALWANLGWGN
jgi:hypothetical protein